MPLPTCVAIFIDTLRKLAFNCESTESARKTKPHLANGQCGQNNDEPNGAVAVVRLSAEHTSTY